MGSTRRTGVLVLGFLACASCGVGSSDTNAGSIVKPASGGTDAVGGGGVAASAGGRRSTGLGGKPGDTGGSTGGLAGAANAGSGGMAGQPPSAVEACMAYCRVQSMAGCPIGPTMESCNTATCDGFPRAEACKSEYYLLRTCLIALGPSGQECIDRGTTNRLDGCKFETGNLGRCINQ